MAELNFNWLLTSMKGKACGHDEVYTKTNKQTGKSYAVKLCNPIDGENATAAQMKQRNKFGALCKAVSEWMTKEKAAEGGDGSLAYNKALAAYKGQHKIGSFRGFIMNKYATYDDATGNVTIEVGSIKTDVKPSTPPSGGGGSEEGDF